MKDQFNFKKYIDNNPLLQEEGSMYSQLAGNVSDETLGELINAIRKATKEGITHGAIMNLIDQLGPKPFEPGMPNPGDIELREWMEMDGYSEAVSHRDEYMPEDEGAMMKYYDLINSGDPRALGDFILMNADLGILKRYLPRGGTIYGLAYQLMKDAGKIQSDADGTIQEAFEFTIKGDRIRGSGDFHPDVVVLEDPDGVRLSQKIANRKSVILLSNKQAKELKDSL